jgi:biotin synthase-like enzyme
MVQKRELAMMRLTISAVAVVALIVAAARMLSPSSSVELSAAAMPSLQELHTMAGVNTIPVQEIEDQSLVYPSATKR